jgi:hypothetical protein
MGTDWPSMVTGWVNTVSVNPVMASPMYAPRTVAPAGFRKVNVPPAGSSLATPAIDRERWPRSLTFSGRRPGLSAASAQAVAAAVWRSGRVPGFSSPVQQENLATRHDAWTIYHPEYRIQTGIYGYSIQFSPIHDIEGSNSAPRASAPLGAVFGHAQAQRQVEHLPGLDPDHRRVGQVRTAAAALVTDVLDDLIGATWARCAPGRRAACRAAMLGLFVGMASGPRGLRSPSEDGGLEELEKSLASRPSSSLTRALSTAIRRACSEWPPPLAA